MGHYRYEAIDRSGKQVKGIIEAPKEDVIIERLRGMGFFPLKVVPHRVSAKEFDLFSIPILRIVMHRIKFKHIVTFTRQLATLIDAGLPILRSLYILQEQVESVLFKSKIKQMAQDIEAGTTLSEALAKHPKQFDKLYVSMVRAGEIGGVLESILNKISEFMEKRQALISKVRSAMMYPIVVGIVAMGLTGFILWKIVPKFKDIFEKLGAAELPGLTQFLVTASNIVVEKGLWVIAGIILIILTFRQIYRTREGKYVIDRLSLKLPIFGTIFLKVAIVRFAGTLSTLITAGVPILQSLDIVRETSGNEVVSRAVGKVYNSVKDGETIHEPLREAKVFPPLVVHMVAVGEETGAIDNMLIKVAQAYEREVDDTVNALTSIIEPLLIVFLGGIVGVIVVALYLPLFTIPKLIK